MRDVNTARQREREREEVNKRYKDGEKHQPVGGIKKINVSQELKVEGGLSDR